MKKWEKNSLSACTVKYISWVKILKYLNVHLSLFDLAFLLHCIAEIDFHGSNLIERFSDSCPRILPSRACWSDKKIRLPENRSLFYIFHLEMIFKCRVRERLIWKPWYVTHRNSQSKYFNELKSFKIFSISRTHLKFNFSKLKNLIEYLKCLSWSETKHSGAMYPSRKLQQSIN